MLCLILPTDEDCQPATLGENVTFWGWLVAIGALAAAVWWWVG